MRHQPDLAPQRRSHAEPEGSFLHDLGSAVAALAFFVAVAFILMATIVPDLPA